MNKLSRVRIARIGLLTAAGSALWGVTPARAEEPAKADANEIVVTARKTNERIQDVPVSITAITADSLRDRGAADIKDVLRNVPGLSNGGFERGLSRYSLRGLATGAASPTVGIYLDDISLVTIATTFSGGYDPVFFDMQRVEVLKGPQGTLYGGSAMGGAIKYVSATPDMNQFGVDAAGGLAFTDKGSPSYTGEVVANIPVVEGRLAVRAGAYYRRDGGFVDNKPGDLRDTLVSSTPFPTYTPLTRDSLTTRTAKDQNRGDTFALRLSAEWRPDDSWSIRPQIFYQDYMLANTGEFFLGRPGLTSSFRIPQPSHDQGTIYSLNVEKDLGPVRVTSLTAYFDRTFNYTRDYSYFVGSVVPFLYAANSKNVSISQTGTFSQEVRIASSGGPDARFKWLVGGYYSSQNDRLVQYVDTPGAALLLGTDRLYFGDTSTRTKQYAGFGEATLTLLRGFDITAGVRVFEIDQMLNIVGDGPLNGGPSAISGRQSKEHGVNPKFGASYKITRDNMLYASAAKGFRPGGPNRYRIDPTLCAADLATLGIAEAPATFESDNLWTYEAGTKNSFAGGRIQLNAAAYYTKWKKIQQQVGLPTCGFGFTANVGEAEVKGFELEGRVAPWSGVEIGGNLAYTDAEITKAAPGTSTQVGDEVQEVPKWTGTAYLGYAFALTADWRLSLRGEYQYQGRALYDSTPLLPVTYANGIVGGIANPERYRRPYEVVNAFASLTRGNTALRIYANNILNARPVLDTNLITGADRAYTIRPRTIGFELRQHF